MNLNTAQTQESRWPLSVAHALLSAGGIAAITGILTWLVATSYERGEQTNQLQHLNVRLAKLENVEEQRIAMKERAEAAERYVTDLREQILRLQRDLDSTKQSLAKAQTSISKSEKCVFLENLARTSDAQYRTAVAWAVKMTNGYSSEYYRQASSNYELDRKNLTACLTSSTN